MGKRGKSQQKGPRDSKKIKPRAEHVDVNDMDDEIDLFHKKRDMIPLDINADVESDDDDDEQAVLSYKGIDDEDEDEDEDDEYDDSKIGGLEAKIVKTQKYMKGKFGDPEDESDDDAEVEERKGTMWSKGGRKDIYHNTDVKDYELLSSGEDTPAEEEEEVIKMQKERAEFLREEDFGLQIDDEDDSDEEPTLGEKLVKDKTTSKSSGNRDTEDDSAPVYEVKKDLNALSRDEQMDVVQSSAPELVGLLDELNDAMNQLENQVKPLVSKIKKADNAKKERMHYLEVKQLLLLAYCQAITFYLLLKSEGQPVRDHPVIARLVEIKSLLDKIKELDGHLPNGFEDILHENEDVEPTKKPAATKPALTFDLQEEMYNLIKEQVSKLAETVEPVKKPSTEVKEKKRRRDQRKEDSVSLESVKMLQYRAALEEKLKLKAVSGSVELKTDKSKKQKSIKLNGKLETTDDFDDDAMDLDGTTRNDGRSSTLSSKVSKFITPQNKKRKGVSGDADLPERDDLGEKRSKHELRVMAGAEIKSGDDKEQSQNESSDGAEVEGNGETDESDDDFYNQVKLERNAKRAMKAGKYSRTGEQFYEPETTVDGKRLITTKMEKNKGLTPHRKKEKKNPRKKYRDQHANAVKRRKGQVQEIKKQKGSYGGQETGINARVTRSIRLKG